MTPRLDPAWLDAQYNNRGLVADYAQHLARWAQASAQARASALARGDCDLDVAYGAKPSEKLDVFFSGRPTDKAAPVLLFIHGGYWRALDKSDASFVAPAFTDRGALVVVPNYALCPAVSIENIVLQLVQAVAWTWRHAARYGGDPKRIVVAGHSAGGHLVSMLLSCRWRDVADDLPAQPLVGGLAISGVYDLEPIRHTPFLQADLRLTPASVARLSPAFFPRPKSTRLLAAVGADESSEFLRHNALIRDVWGPTAVPVCDQVAGTNHFSVLNSLAEPAGYAHQLALRLLGLS
jgi:arylformamidase